MSTSAKIMTILALCAFGTLAQTHSASAATAPGRVHGVHVIAKTARRVELDWPKQAGAKYYEVRVEKDGETIMHREAEHSTYVVKGLQPNTSYDFRVRARSGGCGACIGKYSWRLKTRTKITVASEVGTSQPLYGFWGLNGYISADGLADVKNRFGATVFQVASSAPQYTVATLLPMVRSAGLHVTLRMTDDHDAYTTDGDFDLNKWKAQVAEWAGSGVQEFIDDGTLVGHMLLDDIDTFAGLDPTAEELDEMARYSKVILPHLLTFVRERATQMPFPDNKRHAYIYLDAVDHQYKANDGLISKYVTSELTQAKLLHLKSIYGLNIADGGDGSSGQPGWGDGKYAMSADEIVTYGTQMLAVPHLQMLLLWEYDGVEQWSDGSIGADYFDQTELQEALANLSTQAAEYAQ